MDKHKMSPQKYTVRNKSLTQTSGAFIMGGFNIKCVKLTLITKKRDLFKER